MTVSKQTELYVWNVEDGTSIYAKTPNGKNVVIDCGASDDFSPVEHINNELNVQEIDYLIISHPHKDHIKDLDGIERYYDSDVGVLRRSGYITKDLMIRSNEDLKDDECLGKYFELSDRYTGDVKREESPRYSNWGDGCVFKCFNNKYSEDGAVNNSTINNLSVVTFVRFGNNTVLYGGDMEEEGWEEMLTKDRFKEFLKETTIYIASHHGNKSGFSSELFEHLKPKLTIISAGKKHDYDAANEYRDHTTGMGVFKDGGQETRWIVTTRNDGHIHITLYDDGAEPRVNLGCPPKA